MYDQVANDWGRDETREGEDVGEGVDVFVGGEEGGEWEKPRKRVSG